MSAVTVSAFGNGVSIRIQGLTSSSSDVEATMSYSNMFLDEENNRLTLYYPDGRGVMAGFNTDNIGSVNLFNGGAETYSNVTELYEDLKTEIDTLLPDSNRVDPESILLLKINQSGASTPTGTAIYNGLSASTPTYTRVSDGEYTIVLAGAFPANRVYPIHGDPDGANPIRGIELYVGGSATYAAYIDRIDNNSLRLTTREEPGGSVIDGVLTDFIIKFEVYPAP